MATESELDVPVKATERALEVAEAIGEADGATLAELVEVLDLPKSTLHDHLTTLSRLGWLVQEDDQYRIGCRFLELGGRRRKGMKIYRLGTSEVEKLARQTGQHANLMIEEDGKGVFLYKAKGENAVQLDTYVGMRVHLHTTALGKCILAYTAEGRVREIIDRHGLPEITEKTITDEAELLEELSVIRERGYAVDDEERVEGMRCVAAPLTDGDDRARGAISVSGPSTEMQGDRLDEDVPDEVCRIANVLEVNLTYS